MKTANNNINKIALTIGFIVILNLASHFLYKRFDLTADKRYTLSQTSLNIDAEVKEPLYIDKQEIDTCSICKEQQCNIQTYCNHTFCESCLTNWIKKNKTCPYCRSLLENKEYYIISSI